jgi:hypothetical protein
MARKLERAADLDHVQIWTRTPDAQVLRNMLYPIDRGCAKLRATAASLLAPLAAAQDLLARVHVRLDQLEGVAVAPDSTSPLVPPGGPDPNRPLTPQEKRAWRAYRQAIAGQYGVDFYWPRSPEGRRLAVALSALDTVLIQARSGETLEHAGPLLERTGQLIRAGHELATTLAQQVRLDYQPHPLLKRALNQEPSLVDRIIAEAAQPDPLAAAPGAEPTSASASGRQVRRRA